MWDSFQANAGGILIVGHGTRVASGVAQLIELSAQIQRILPKIPIEASFLELAVPTIADAMKRLRSRGVHRVLVLPILLFEAGHAQSDIPEAVEQAAKVEGISIVGQSPPLGMDAEVLRLSEHRFLEGLRCRNDAGCLAAGACPRASECLHSNGDSPSTLFLQSKERRIGLAMVGRGASDPNALDQMRRFAAQRIETSQVPMAWTETGFFTGGQPTVDELLKNAQNSGCDTIVVQPHLLFEGELVGQLRKKVELYQRESTKCRWLVTPTLGSDANLAKAFVSIASETLNKATQLIRSGTT